MRWICGPDYFLSSRTILILLFEESRIVSTIIPVFGTVLGMDQG
jgi:hypothetical protein